MSFFRSKALWACLDRYSLLTECNLDLALAISISRSPGLSELEELFNRSFRVVEGVKQVHGEGERRGWIAGEELGRFSPRHHVLCD